MTMTIRTASLITLIVAAVLAVGCSTSPPPADAVAADLTARLDALVASHAGPDTPGLAIGIVRDGELVASTCRGLANLEHRVPVTPRTRFHVASVSKQFTGYAVHLLAARGALALDDRVGDHLEDMPACVAAITIDQLLHHTSGLRQTMRLQAVAGRRHDRLLTQSEALDLIRAHRELNFEPGTDYIYSNSNYIVLATIVEAITGERFADWMQTNVFAPLDLERTLIVDSYATIVPDRARSYGRADDGFVHDSGLFWAIYGGTGVHTTLEDLARWVAFLMDPPPEAAAVVGAMQEPGTLADGTPLRYASGLAVDEYRGLRRVAHGGEGDGVHTFVTWFPEVGVGAVLLENAPLASEGQTAMAAADLVLDGIDGVETATEAERTRADDAPSALPESLRRRLAGRFLILDESAEYAPEILRFEREGEGLVVIPPPGGRLPLAAGAPGRFGVAGAPVEFVVPDGDGVITHMTIRLPDRTRPMRRLDDEPGEAQPPSSADYVGRYHSPEVDTDFDVALAGETLVLRHPVHGEVALRHIHGDTFGTDRNILLWIHFERGEDGAVRGFRLTNHNRRVSRLWFERIRDAAGDGQATAR